MSLLKAYSLSHCYFCTTKFLSPNILNFLYASCQSDSFRFLIASKLMEMDKYMNEVILHTAHPRCHFHVQLPVIICLSVLAYLWKTRYIREGCRAINEIEESKAQRVSAQIMRRTGQTQRVRRFIHVANVAGLSR